MSRVDDSPMGQECPGCGGPPNITFVNQSFCGNMACNVLTWNPSMTLDELLIDDGVFTVRDLDELFGEDAP